MHDVRNVALEEWRLDPGSNFTNQAKSLAPNGSSFQHGVRDVAGGALALAFLAATLTHMLGVPSGLAEAVTIAAGVVGGISGKLLQD